MRMSRREPQGGGSERLGSRSSRSGTGGRQSGKRNAAALHVSGEAWQFQTSLGHSPFELLFARQPQTLLGMLAEQWEETEEEVKDLLTYTRELRENLHTVWEEAHTTLGASQSKQKHWYDAKSVFRSLKVGDKALVLLPSCENKFVARWQGPYEVIEQINPPPINRPFQWD
ncbi:hypothetical protein NDU88_011570 [Pleurodeles waltl]|uniref:Gag polyprotein n=1 Tax=Pleurodeles waltl TaxID=8319 RepID=A0AAV7Q544_PLEWA|nr:hypothetical protein NDU88_011570 [Pleurodeles waltl]